MNIVLFRRLPLALAIAAAMAGSGVQANEILDGQDGWNKANVETEAGPYYEGEIYNSFVYTDDTKSDSNGGIIWEEGDVQSPGMQVVTNGLTDEKCIMTEGDNPTTEEIDRKDCSDPFQTSKRFKVVSRVADGAVDLVFNVDDTTGTYDVYRILEKYSNITGARLAGFTLELGSGTGDDFTPSLPGDGLGFSDQNGVVWDPVTPTTNDPDDPDAAGNRDLDAVFAFGLFGDADTDRNHRVDGYYDSVDRGRFYLSALEDSITTTGITTNVTDLYGGVIGSWLSKNQVPYAFAFDDDGDDTTEAILVADWNGTEWQTYRNVLVNLVPESVSADTISAWIMDPAYTVGPVEDFGNINLNMHLTISEAFVGEQFTLRITSEFPGDSESTPWNDALPWMSDVGIERLKLKKKLTAGSVAPVKVTVRNYGPDEVVNGEVFLYAENEDGTIGARFTGELDNLRSGRKVTLAFDWLVPEDPGTVTWHAEVVAFAAEDPDETNNQAMGTVVVQ